MDKDKETVNVELTRDEALILFEWLAHFDETKSTALQDKAEQRVLWSLEEKLEKELVEIVEPEYRELLAKAKERLSK